MYGSEEYKRKSGIIFSTSQAAEGTGMNSIREESWNGIAKAYSESTGKGILTYLSARRGGGFETKQLVSALSESKIVTLSKAIGDTPHTADIVIAVGVLRWQNPKRFPKVLELATALKRYSEENFEMQTVLERVSDDVVVVSSSKEHLTAFDGLLEHTVNALLDSCKKNEIEQAMDIVDQVKQVLDARGQNVLKGLKEISEIVGYKVAKGISEDAPKKSDLPPAREDQLYYLKEFDEKKLDPLAEKALGQIKKRPSSISEIAVQLKENGGAVSKAMLSLSKLGYVQHDRLGTYHITREGTLFLRQQGLFGFDE